LRRDHQDDVHRHRRNARDDPIDIIRPAEDLGQHRHPVRVENHPCAPDVPDDAPGRYRADIAVEIREEAHVDREVDD